MRCTASSFLLMEPGTSPEGEEKCGRQTRSRLLVGKAHEGQKVWRMVGQQNFVNIPDEV